MTVHDYGEYILNPLYTGLILYVLVILLVIFCFQSFEMKCSEHIKFFIYCFTIFSLLVIYYKKKLEIHFKENHNLSPNLKIVEDVHKAPGVRPQQQPNNNNNIDILIPNQ